MNATSRPAHSTHPGDTTGEPQKTRLKPFEAFPRSADFRKHADISPPSCGIYASRGDAERCPSVLLLHGDATPCQLLGFAHGRARELAMLANLAASSMEG